MSILIAFLSKVFDAVLAATKILEEKAQLVAKKVSEHRRNVRSYQQWQVLIDSWFDEKDNGSRQIANLMLAITFLICKSRRAQDASPEELQIVWDSLRKSIQSQVIQEAQLSVNRSAQGFLAIPLCSVITDGNIETLFRLHVWLPDGQREAPGFGVHSHQPFAQSWVLAGNGQDQSYAVQPVDNGSLATHARYAIAWTSNVGLDAGYKTHQTYSKVVNTGEFMLAKPGRIAAHHRGMSYSIPAASFHSSGVSPDTLHATLFLFDSSQGFVQDAPVLGPKDAEEYTQIRDAAGISPTHLAALVQSVRRLEDLLVRSQQNLQRVEWRQAFEALRNGVVLCESSLDSANMSRYHKLVLADLTLLMRTHKFRDPLETAKWRFWYGRALFLNSRPEEALAQFNYYDSLTPAIACCKEPSEESRDRLRHLVSAGADIEQVDEDGCSALDYTIMTGDIAAESIITGALREKLIRNAESELHQRIREARLRRQFRDIFKEIMRPMLLNDSVRTLLNVRRAYAKTLSRDSAKARAFDVLKYIRYCDLRAFGRFPRSSDGLTQPYRPKDAALGFLLFLSYRWINPKPWAQVPDDVENTQYLRTLQAIEDFLKLHPTVQPDKLGIWIDFACIDQEFPEPGIAALPMNLAQCDAVISLVDNKYYDRAWCSVETMMIQALQKSYRLHLWYEYVRGNSPAQSTRSTLRPGRTGMKISLREKLLRYEEDRPKILFLERQYK